MKYFGKVIGLFLFFWVICFGPPAWGGVGDNLPRPSASFTSTPASDNLREVTFDASGSTAGSGATITSYEWRFETLLDDFSNPSSQPIATHIYPDAGTYSVTLRVTNSRAQSDTKWSVIQVTSSTPTPSSTPTSSPTPSSTPTTTPLPTETTSPSLPPTPPPTPSPTPSPTPTPAPTPIPSPPPTPTPAPATDLEGIIVSSGTLCPDFQTGVEFYEVNVEFETDRLTVTPISNNTNLNIQIDRKPVRGGTASQPLSLEVGRNTFYVSILSSEGETLKSYLVQGIRAAPLVTSLMFNHFLANPHLFSPGWSPERLDETIFGGTLYRGIPLSLTITSGGSLIETIPPSEIKNYPGGNVACFVPDRFRWNGLHPSPLPSGLYDIDVSTSVELQGQIGRLNTDQRGILYRPHALAVDSSGYRYVGSSGNPLQVFGSDGQFIRFIGSKKMYDALAFTPQGKLVALCSDQLILFESDGSGEQVLYDFHAQGITIDWLDGLAVRSDGTIFVSCKKEGKVLVLTPSGVLIREIEMRGESDPAFFQPGDIALGPDNRLYVNLLEIENGMPVGKVKIYSEDGTLADTLTLRDGRGSPLLVSLGAIGVLPDGSIVITSRQEYHPLLFSGQEDTPFFHYFYRFSPQGQLLNSWGKGGRQEGEFCWVSRIVVQGDTIYASDHYGNNRVVVMTATGSVVQTLETPPGKYIEPVGMARTTEGRMVIADNGLERCTVLRPDGTVESVFRTWTFFINSEGIKNIFSSPDGTIYCSAGANQLAAITPQGNLIRNIPLETKGEMLIPGGLLVDVQGNLILCGQSPGQIWFFDPVGHLVKTLSLSSQDEPVSKEGLAFEKNGFFGPLCPAPEKGMFVQSQITDPKGEITPAFCEIDLEKGVIRKTVLREVGWEKDHIIPRISLSREEDLLASFAVGDRYFYKACFDSVVAFDREGKFQWSLGQEPGPSFTMGTLLADGKDLTLLEVNRRPVLSVRVENWTVDQDIHLASGQVEIDNIPPRITLAQTEGLITTSDSQVVLSGDIEDRNFDFYQVWYRRQGSERGWNPVAPSSPEIDFKERPREGVLARWFVLRDYRDSGIEVKVVAWDKAGNSSESTTRLAFDDDQDGMSNAEEIALGTDPRQFSRIEIQTDLKTLVTPYFFAGIEHPLHFYVTDVSDPDHPRPLPNAKLNISIDAGIYSQAEETVIWQSPDVDSQLVTVTCTLSRSDEIPVSGGKTENLLEARFNLLVMRDQDRDWMPDTREVSAPTSDSFSTYLNNSDSDGDGVMDGVDIAPRTTYQDNWNKTYYPGMLGKMLPLCFYGIGGEGSHTVRYYFVEDENGEKGTVYHELEREGIFESDVTNAGKMKTLANSHLFPGQTGELQPYFGLSTPSSNLPGRITIHQAGESGSQLDTPSWNSIKQQLSDEFDALTDINIPSPGTEDKPSLLLTPPPGGQEKPQQPFAISSFEGDVNQLTAGGDEYLAMYEFMISKKGPEYIDFYYSSKIASGNAIVNNVEPIDVSTYLETGIHRGYLVVVAPGSNGYYDRTLTIQWRVNAEKDKTQLPTRPGGPSTKMGWLVEVFHPDNVFLPPNFLILQTSSTEDFPKLGPRLPWNKALFTEPILAQAQDEHLYYATVNIPGEHLKPGNALYIKLTPFWVKDEGGKVSFQPLETSPKYMKTLTLEPNRVVFAILRDPPYQPITVSGITVETVSPTQEWIPRRKTRPNYPLDPGTLEQLIAAIMASHPDWPMNLGSTDFFPLINGVSYTVRCFSTIGMEEQWKRGGLAPSLSQSIQQNSLDTVDVVCLLTPNRRDCSLLMQAIRWGSIDEWLVEGDSLSGGGESLSSTSFEVSGESSLNEKTRSEQDASSLLDQLKTVKNMVSGGIKTYSSIKKIVGSTIQPEPVESYSFFDLGEGTSIAAQYEEFLTMQKCSSGKIHLTKKTSDVQSIPGGQISRVKEKSEIVDENALQQSALSGQNFQSPQFKALLAGLKTGTILVSNGIQIYTCYSRDDWVGVGAYTLKAGVELSSTGYALAGIVAETRMGSYLPLYLAQAEKSLWVKGIPVASMGGSVSVVGIVVGTIETGYNIYLYTQADDVMSKKEAARNTCACAIDAGIVTIEPLGGLVMGFWIIGSEVVKLTLKYLDMEPSPYIKKIMSSPGQFLTYTLVKIDPKSAPVDKAMEACTKAQQDAIKKCKKNNSDPQKKYIYIFVPPE